MGNRLSKIVTRTGDGGKTGLSDGSRVDKDSPRMEAIGTIDELSSQIGFAQSFVAKDQALAKGIIYESHMVRSRHCAHAGNVASRPCMRARHCLSDLGNRV